MMKVDEKRKQLQDNLDKLDKLNKLQEIYPDLEVHKNRWKQERFSSALVNDKVTNCEIRHNCGCCTDSPLEVWPYIETKNGRVYSKPARYTVGEQHWIAGDKPYEGWEMGMQKANIPQNIIDIVIAHFEKGKQERKQLCNE